MTVRTFAFITVHPAFIEAYAKFGVFRAAERASIAIQPINLRQFAVDKHGSVDDAPFGGGDGMVLRPEPLVAALEPFTRPRKVFVTSPSGRPWTQADAALHAASGDDLIFISGRFAGIDDRFLALYVDEEISLGDFVISGGELACLTLADSVLRLIPGVLGNQQSAKEDSFGTELDSLLEYPLYTRPLEFEGLTVPDVLLSGDHKKIAEWRRAEALKKTERLRPDLFEIYKTKNPSKR
ncbi:MAG: tRNA (guanosine(37)-N1)-methyltransferase TrmD [Chitinophagaceae bacterium]|nr:tRNA (guanosine(37)-N1)-methyltransferase TrmD [Oligoflexus sp.]